MSETPRDREEPGEFLRRHPLPGRPDVSEQAQYGGDVNFNDGFTDWPHPALTRLAVEVLYMEFLSRVPGTMTPQEQAVDTALGAMHEMLWAKEMQAVADTGITSHYLVIRPLNLLCLPEPAQVAEIRDALATLVRYGLIAQPDGW
jgi:hypothetical protein